MTSPRIVVAGAGSIGCFAGGLLAFAGRTVTLLARPRISDEIAANGLTLTDFSGLSVSVPANALTVTDDPACLSQADIVLVTVKSRSTPDIAALIAAHAPPEAVIVSYQNGITNADVLRRVLPGRDVRAGMVPFNVMSMGQGRFHRGTSGDIVIGPGPGGIAAQLSCPDMNVTEDPDIEAVQWGKLLINLNNALNALSGLTVHQQLLDRRWRRLMADQMEEALAVLRAAGIRAAPTTPLPMRFVPFVLRLPTPVFRRIAARMLTIDTKARSSMWEDLTQRRPTEIDALQGEIQQLARANDVATPLIDRIVAAISKAETAGQGAPGLAPGDLQA